MNLKVPHLELSREHTLEHADFEKTAVSQAEVIFEIRRAGSASHWHCYRKRRELLSASPGEAQVKTAH